MFGGSGALTVSAGITLVYVLGATLPNWKWVCIACGSIPIAVFALMPLLPETPNYLIMNGEKQRAYEVIKNTLLILQILILSEVFQMLTLQLMMYKYCIITKRYLCKCKASFKIVNVNLKYLIILTFYRVDYEIASIHVLMGFRISETLF